MARKLWDWQVFEPLAVTYGAKTVRLSGDSLALFLCTEGLTELDRWKSGESDPTDVEADSIEALTALAYRELMTNAMIGTIAPYMTASPPDGMLACDGSTHLRADYPDLYAALASAFIVDADHFITPDLRGRVVLGAGTGAGGLLSTYLVGGNGGQEQHALTNLELPEHNHPILDPGHSHTLTDPGHSHTLTDPGHTHTLNNPTHSHTLTDPGHSHTLTDPGHIHTVTDPGHVHTGARAATNQQVADGTVKTVPTSAATNTGSNTTGVTINSHTTGITEASNTTGITSAAAAAGQTAQSATTGITEASHATGITEASALTGIATDMAGTSARHENRQPYMALNFGVWAT